MPGTLVVFVLGVKPGDLSGAIRASEMNLRISGCRAGTICRPAVLLVSRQIKFYIIGLN